MKYINILFLICGLNSQSIIIIDRISTIFDIPSFGGNIIGYTNKGDQFEFRSERGGWYEISLNNDIGYIYIPKVKEITTINNKTNNLKTLAGKYGIEKLDYFITQKANYDDIALPLIPVYFDNGGYIKSLLPNGYYEVFSRDKAFIEIKIEKEYLISKNIRAITPFAIYFISSFKMVNEDYSSFGILAGSLIVGTLSYFY